MPRVTVAMLAYDRPDFLAEAIESVLAQTYNDYKLVVYDNCSEKDLKSVVDRYDDSRIIYHRNEKNLGQFGNAIQAIDLCDTEFLQFAHDDDRMFPWALEWLVEAMDTHPEIGMASASRWHIMGSGDFSHYKNDKRGRVFKTREIAENNVHKHTNISFSGMLIRPDILREVGHNFRTDKGVATDFYFVLEGNLKGIPCFGYQAPLIEYRVHPGSGSVDAKLKGWIRSSKLCMDLIREYIDDETMLDAIRDTMMLFVLGASFQFVCDDNSDIDIDDMESVWSDIEDEFDTHGKRQLFIEYEYLMLRMLGPITLAIGQGKRPISDYFKQKNILRAHGIHVPMSRELKWFLKYVVWQRWLGRR